MQLMRPAGGNRSGCTLFGPPIACGDDHRPMGAGGEAIRGEFLNVSPCSPAGASSRATSTCDGIATRNGIMLVSHIRHLQERKA